MKRCLFYLLVVLCVSGLFSCGDDKKDEPGPDESWKQIAGDYSGNKLKLNLNETAILGNTVKIEAVSAEKVTVTLTNLLPGVKELKIDAPLYKALTKPEEAPLSFFGGETKLTNDSRTVVIGGYVQSGVLDLTVEVKVDSPIIGNWRLAPYKEGDMNGDGIINDSDYNLAGGGFFLYLASLDDQITFMGKTMTDMEFCSAVDQKAEAFLTATLKEIVFQPHGGVTFIYSKDGKEVPLSNLAGFYEKDKMIYLTLNIAGLLDILKDTKADITPSGIEELLALARNGIPLAYEQTGNNNCKLMINKDMAVKMLPALTDALPVLLALMTDKPETVALLKEIGKLAAGIPSFDRFEMGFNLEKRQ